MDDDHNMERDRDIALARRVRDGDMAAFTALVTHYVESVTRVAFYIVGSHDQADDIAQNVFVTLWENRHLLDPERQIKPYLFRIARNQALNERKAIAVRERYRNAWQDNTIVSDSPRETRSSEEHILTKETIQSILRQFPERWQSALRLRIEEDMTHAEIAETLNVTPEAAQRLVSRAMAALRKKLRV